VDDISFDEAEGKVGAEDTRPPLDALDFALVADFIEVESDLSRPPLPPVPGSMFDKDALGLSVFPLPGILDRIEPRRERDDSFVSDLLKDG
jgi:hypothetical protein